ncbi:GIY-YIG nuclease family protein [Xanthocytophaga flava]|uniref:GIY-YIG nuclease family protein n=1 Tax=Xanthocytophaga flava TaxID=3048013 RepID=UPI0028D25491|nr:GIY-YIG nuclease family protein [Xanthocytophaga flavus]
MRKWSLVINNDGNKNILPVLLKGTRDKTGGLSEWRCPKQGYKRDNHCIDVTMYYYVYITTNPTKTTLYTGVTNDLARRMAEHRENRGNPGSFTGKYHCYKLLYYETFQNINDAISREKEIKLMKHDQKIALIQNQNPRMGFLWF